VADIDCSKGTYIRSLAHDLGRALNNGAYLTGLVRTAIGDFKLSEAQELVDFVAAFPTE
jgi:tRNA pseudouridine55 synthase